jgi:hypothetical protein
MSEAFNPITVLQKAVGVGRNHDVINSPRATTLQPVTFTTGTTDDGHMRIKAIMRGRVSTYSKLELICAQNNYSSRDDSPDLLIPGS